MAPLTKSTATIAQITRSMVPNAVMIPTFRITIGGSKMGDNAFDPVNTHLWARCETHQNDPLPAGQTCIFVEDCDECLQDCRHDYSYDIHELLG
jgi:hypothetical protein